MITQNPKPKVDIFAYMKETAKEVDSYILDYLKNFEEPITHLPKLRCGVKRGKPKVIPTLGRLAFESVCDDEWKKIVPILSAFELGTDSCYVIDDILDNQGIREGDLSTASKYGTNKAIIASMIQNLLSNEILLNSEIKSRDKGKVLSLWNEILKTIYLGQNKNEDIISRNYLENYLERCYSLAGVAGEKVSEICSIVGNASDREKETLKNFGKNYGIACQIRNDLLDMIPQEVIGNRSQSLTRNSYEDVRKGILTYPLIYAMNNGHKGEVTAILNKKENGQFSKLTEILIESGAMRETANLTKDYMTKAIDSTKLLRECKSKDYMIELARLLRNSEKYTEGFLEKMNKE